MTTLTPKETTEEQTERLMSEGLIGLADASKILGEFNGGRGVHAATFTRWIKRGIQLSDGSRLKLEAIPVAGRLCTTRPAIVRFLSRQREPIEQNDLISRSPTVRRKAAEVAARELEVVGV